MPMKVVLPVGIDLNRLQLRILDDALHTPVKLRLTPKSDWPFHEAVA